MHHVLSALLVICLLLSGCTESGTAPDDYRLTGTFTDDAEQEDLDDLGNRAQQRGAEVRFMETSPVRFDAQPLSRSECENLQLELQQVDYLQEVDECRVITGA